MIETDLIWMSLVIFVPSAFALVLMLFPSPRDEANQERWNNAVRYVSLLGTALTLGISLGMFVLYYQQVYDHHVANPGDGLLSKRAEKARNDPQAAGVPDAARKLTSDWVGIYPWISRFNIEYYLGVDGISMPLILLTTALSFLAMIASWRIDKYVRAYCILFLLLETGMVGTFLALDFFLFYIFWEVMLLPMYFLIGIWGGPRREYAAIKFFLYTLLGSVFILIALLGFYFTNLRDFVDPVQVQAAAEQRVKEKGETIDEARSKVEIHTFDLIALARA